MSVVGQEEEKVFSVGEWRISFRYKRDAGRSFLNCVAISPLTPFEAEILKVSLGIPMEWSYDDRSKTVELWISPLHKAEPRKIESEIISTLVRVVPELARELSMERFREKLAERGWIVSVEGSRVAARRSLHVGRKHIGYVEAEVAESGGLFRGEIIVVILAETWERSQELAARLSAGLKVPPVSEFPFLRFRVIIREGILPQVEEQIINVFKIVRREVLR
mgnify:CR=1 FL=1